MSGVRSGVHVWLIPSHQMPYGVCVPPILSPTMCGSLSFHHPCFINEAYWLCPSPSEPGCSSTCRPSEQKQTPLMGVCHQRLLKHMAGRNASSFTLFLDEGKVFISLVLILLPGLWKRQIPPLCPLYFCLLLSPAPCCSSSPAGFWDATVPQSHGKLCMAVALHAHHAH